MKTVIRHLPVVLLALGASSLVASCLQSEGERCQVTADCAGDLVCCVRDDAVSRMTGGICTLPNKCELDLADSGVSDSSTDAGTEEDASADAATADAADAATAADAEIDQSQAADDAAADAADGSASDAESDADAAQ